MSDHLERNLRELLRRYEPVVLDADFRERLGARVLGEAGRLAAERRVVRPALPRAARPVWTPALLAAATLLALLTAGWWLWHGGSAGPALEDLLAHSGAAAREVPAGDWHAAGSEPLALADGYLEVASDGRAALRIELPDLGSVELPAGLPHSTPFLQIVLERSDRGPTRARMLQGAAVAHLPFGDRELPEGSNVVLARDAVGFDGGDAAGGEGREPEALVGEPAPTSAGPDEPHGAAELIGHITRAEDGAPLTEARLVLVKSDVTAEGPDELVNEVRDAHGAFRWSGLQPGRYHLFVQAEGFAVAITRHVIIDASLVLPPLDIRLERGRTLRGRVVDAVTGSPVAGALVLSDSDAPAIMLALYEEGLKDRRVQTTHTDEDGRFELTHLTTGPQLLRATHPGRGPAFAEAAPDAAEVELQLPPGGSVTGEVRSEDGKLWAGAVLVAAFTNPLPSGRCMNYGFALTDEQGLYRMDDLPVGQGVVLLLGAPDATQHMPPIESLTIRAGEMSRVNFGTPHPTDEGGTLLGYLAEADGTPADGRMVSVMSASWEQTGHFETSMVDEHGEWRIERLPGDTYWIYVVFDVQNGTVARVGRVDVPATGEVRYSAQLPAGGLAGRVLGPAGTPVGRADLVIEQRETTGGWEFVAHFVADEAGAWECTTLAPGLYRVTAFDRAATVGAGRSEPVVVGTDMTGGLEVRLAEGGGLIVQVRDGGGAPVAGAAIHLRDARGSDWSFVQVQRTGADGTLQLAGLPVGLWDVEAVGAAGATARTTVDVRAGDPVRAELVLPGP